MHQDLQSVKNCNPIVIIKRTYIPYNCKKWRPSFLYSQNIQTTLSILRSVCGYINYNDLNKGDWCKVHLRTPTNDTDSTQYVCLMYYVSSSTRSRYSELQSELPTGRRKTALNTHQYFRNVTDAVTNGFINLLSNCLSCYQHQIQLN
jgi:hypothetical protein